MKMIQMMKWSSYLPQQVKLNEMFQLGKIYRDHDETYIDYITPLTRYLSLGEKMNKQIRKSGSKIIA